jgi:hypothetical protein
MNEGLVQLFYGGGVLLSAIAMIGRMGVSCNICIIDYSVNG